MKPTTLLILRLDPQRFRCVHDYYLGRLSSAMAAKVARAALREGRYRAEIERTICVGDKRLIIAIAVEAFSDV